MNTLRNLLLVFLPIALCLEAPGLSVPDDEDHVYRDPARKFELDLNSDWQVLPEPEARAVDPEAAVVVRHRRKKIYLAVEARRLPSIALSAWAAAWGEVVADDLRSPFLPWRGGVRARSDRKIEGDWYQVRSLFRRARGFAYRFSRYHPFSAPRDVRTLVRSAARWFRPVATTTTTTSPAGNPEGPDRNSTPLRTATGVAASIAPPVGWEAVADPDSDAAVFLPLDAEFAVRDRVNGYQAGLVALGEVTRRDDLTVRLARWLDEHLLDATDFHAVDLAESVRVTCFSMMPVGRRPEGVPVSWLTEGRIIDGQGIGVLVGVTGLGLDEDYHRMSRAFDGLRTVDPGAWPTRAVCLRDGAIFSPDHGFRLRLPESWAPHLNDADSPTALPSLVLIARRGSAPSLAGLEPPVTARVVSVPDHGAPAFAAIRARLAGRDATLRIRTVRSFGDSRPAWEIRRFRPDQSDLITITLLARPHGQGSIALITRTPAAASVRLEDEIREIHAEFQPTTGTRGEFTARDGARISEGGYEDAARGAHFETRGGWTWGSGGHARAVDPAAVVACWRPESGVRFTLTTERVPGYSVREWAAYLRTSRVRAGPGGRLYTESDDSRGHEKSILEARQGWCYRATLFLPEFADPAERRRGFVPLRTFRTTDAPPAPGGDDRGTAPSSKVGRGSPVVVTCPAGWCFLPANRIETDLPMDVLAAMAHETYGYRAVLVELDGAPDLGDQGARLEALFFREMPGGRVLRPSRIKDDGVWFEAASEIQGNRPGSRLPARWLIRITRLGRRTFAVAAWCKGKSLEMDRLLLEQALRRMSPEPAGSSSDR